MIQAQPQKRPPFNDVLYRALQGYPAHTIEHYQMKPLLEQGERLKLGLRDRKPTVPKNYNAAR